MPAHEGSRRSVGLNGPGNAIVGMRVVFIGRWKKQTVVSNCLCKWLVEAAFTPLEIAGFG
jgi:hypothetical protein